MHKVIGYDAKGHKIWSENDPGGFGRAPLIVNLPFTKIAANVGSSHLRSMEVLRTKNPTTTERMTGSIKK